MKRSAKMSFAGNASYVATLYHLKRFRGTKRGVHQILAVYDARFGKGESDEISHAARAFSLLLAGGALARVMKLTAGDRGAFTFEGLYRSELLTAFKCKSPARCAELHDVCGEKEIRTPDTL